MKPEFKSKQAEDSQLVQLLVELGGSRMSNGRSCAPVIKYLEEEPSPTRMRQYETLQELGYITQSGKNYCYSLTESGLQLYNSIMDVYWNDS